jgi:hypothetical protein
MRPRVTERADCHSCGLGRAPFGARVAATFGGAALLAMRAGSREPGLWLWHGKAPPPSRPKPALRVRQILGRILSAARWGGWLALPGGLTLGLLAASVLLHSTPPDEPVRSDTPTVARPITAEPPAEVAAQTDQVQVPSAPTAQMTAREPERQVAKRRAHRTWSATVRKTHLLLSRRGSSMFEPMTWHGGGY